MQNEIKGYAFDIEGTLYDNGKLQKGVDVLFRNIADTNLPIAFVSGMNQIEIKRVVKLISKAIGKELVPYIASNTGACIQYSAKDQSIHIPIDNKEIATIKRIVSHYPNAIILYRSNHQNFVIQNDNEYYESNTDLILSSNRNFVPVKKLDTKDNVYSIEITSIDQDAVDKIYTELKQKFGGCVLLLGRFIQISHSNKWIALQNIFKKNAKNICYFGDGINDALCIQNCKYAILTNSKNKTMYDILNGLFDNKKFATTDLGNKELIKYVTNQEYNPKTLHELTLEAKSNIIS